MSRAGPGSMTCPRFTTVSRTLPWNRKREMSGCIEKRACMHVRHSALSPLVSDPLSSTRRSRQMEVQGRKRALDWAVQTVEVCHAHAEGRATLKHRAPHTDSHGRTSQTFTVLRAPLVKHRPRTVCSTDKRSTLHHLADKQQCLNRVRSCVASEEL